jgi:uncharacterized protein
MAILVELGLIALALSLAWLGFYDRTQPVQQFNSEVLLDGLRWGFWASLPLIGFLAALHFLDYEWIKKLRRFSHEVIKPLFAGLNYFHFAMIAILAGVGEELFFRWCLQGGVTSLLDPLLPPGMSIGIGLIFASFLFGLCHAATWHYFLLTFVGGLYLGGVMVATENWGSAAVAHAIYDFVALVYIVRMPLPPDPAAAESRESRETSS